MSYYTNYYLPSFKRHKWKFMKCFAKSVFYQVTKLLFEASFYLNEGIFSYKKYTIKNRKVMFSLFQTYNIILLNILNIKIILKN